MAKRLIAGLVAALACGAAPAVAPAEPRNCPAPTKDRARHPAPAPVAGIVLLPGIATGMSAEQVRAIDPALAGRRGRMLEPVPGVRLRGTLIFDGDPLAVAWVAMVGSKRRDRVAAALSERFGRPLRLSESAYYVDSPVTPTGGSGSVDIVWLRWCDGERTFDLNGSPDRFRLQIRADPTPPDRPLTDSSPS